MSQIMFILTFHSSISPRVSELKLNVKINDTDCKLAALQGRVLTLFNVPFPNLVE